MPRDGVAGRDAAMPHGNVHIPRGSALKGWAGLGEGQLILGFSGSAKVEDVMWGVGAHAIQLVHVVINVGRMKRL